MTNVTSSCFWYGFFWHNAILSVDIWMDVVRTEEAYIGVDTTFPLWLPVLAVVKSNSSKLYMTAMWEKIMGKSPQTALVPMGSDWTWNRKKEMKRYAKCFILAVYLFLRLDYMARRVCIEKNKQLCSTIIEVICLFEMILLNPRPGTIHLCYVESRKINDTWRVPGRNRRWCCCTVFMDWKLQLPVTFLFSIFFAFRPKPARLVHINMAEVWKAMSWIKSNQTLT